MLWANDGGSDGRAVASIRPLPYAGGCLARAQDHRDRSAGRGVVDVDRKEATLVVVGVEQGELLGAVNHVQGVVDVEGDGFGLTGVAERTRRRPGRRSGV